MLRALPGLSAASLSLICFLSGAMPPASAQTVNVIDPTQGRDWAPGAIDHAQTMRVFKDAAQSSQGTPPIIPQLEVDADPTGSIATFQPGVATITASNAFFKDLGTNGRTCFTCHQPQDGWTISAKSVRARFDASAGLEPLFRLVDGATCPTADVSNLQNTYSLLITKGLEPISKLSEQDNEAGELDKAEEVLSVEFPADEYAALPLYPGKETLDEPASHIAA